MTTSQNFHFVTKQRDRERPFKREPKQIELDESRRDNEWEQI
jgi:hypothetical protein